MDIVLNTDGRRPEHLYAILCSRQDLLNLMVELDYCLDRGAAHPALRELSDAIEAYRQNPTGSHSLSPTPLCQFGPGGDYVRDYTPELIGGSPDQARSEAGPAGCRLDVSC